MYKKFKLSYISNKGIEEELTVDIVKEKLSNLEEEFTFYYQAIAIYTSFHQENEKIVYELTIEYPDREVYFEFDNVDDLFNSKVITPSKYSLIDLWDLLEN